MLTLKNSIILKRVERSLKGKSWRQSNLVNWTTAAVPYKCNM